VTFSAAVTDQGDLDVLTADAAAFVLVEEQRRVRPVR
jgi:hypothetical protein